MSTFLSIFFLSEDEIEKLSALFHSETFKNTFSDSKTFVISMISAILGTVGYVSTDEKEKTKKL